MENATKALTIAGGVLIAIIVITTLWYSFQQWGLFPSAQDSNKEDDQLIDFNKEFESYNKQNLYGTDVLTVLNKAISNNEKYGITSQPEDEYFIDVEIKIINSICGYTQTVTRNIKTGEQKIGEKIFKENPYLGRGTYELSKMGTEYTKLVNLCNKEPIKTTKKQERDSLKYTYEYAPTTEFRLKYFTCTGISYNKSSGRINKIQFKEVNQEELYTMT